MDLPVLRALRPIRAQGRCRAIDRCLIYPGHRLIKKVSHQASKVALFTAPLDIHSRKLRKADFRGRPLSTGFLRNGRLCYAFEVRHDILQTIMERFGAN